MANQNYGVVLVTVATLPLHKAITQPVAKAIATELIEAKLAACLNLYRPR